MNSGWNRLIKKRKNKRKNPIFEETETSISSEQEFSSFLDDNLKKIKE